MLPFHNAFHSVSSGGPAISPLVLIAGFIGIMTLNISGVMLNKRWLNRVATVSAVIYVSLVVFKLLESLMNDPFGMM
jgi:uncharacterized membrane protein (DUF2068 family)